MFKFIKAACNWVVSKATAAYQAVINFFFSKEEEKKETSEANNGPHIRDAAANAAVQKFNTAVAKNRTKETAMATMASILFGELGTEMNAEELYAFLVGWVKENSELPEETKAIEFSYYTILRQAVVNFTDICGLDISAYDEALASYAKGEK